MPDTLPKPTDPENNPSYPTVEAQVSRKIFNDAWERDQFESATRENFQHAIKNQIVAAVSPEFLEGKRTGR